MCLIINKKSRSLTLSGVELPPSLAEPPHSLFIAFDYGMDLLRLVTLVRATSSLRIQYPAFSAEILQSSYASASVSQILSESEGSREGWIAISVMAVER